MIRRILSAGFGAVLVGVLAPAAALLLDVEPASFSGLLALAGVGACVGLCLGWLFPKVFGFVFEVFLHAAE